jgi:hypothetical protein
MVIGFFEHTASLADTVASFRRQSTLFTNASDSSLPLGPPLTPFGSTNPPKRPLRPPSTCTIVTTTRTRVSTRDTLPMAVAGCDTEGAEVSPEETPSTDDRGVAIVGMVAIRAGSPTGRGRGKR